MPLGRRCEDCGLKIERDNNKCGKYQKKCFSCIQLHHKIAMKKVNNKQKTKKEQRKIFRYIGRKVPTGFEELPGAIHLGKGIWLFNMIKKEEIVKK